MAAATRPRALVGEIMKTIAENRGAAGYVIDGAIRDVAAFAASDFPCYARAVIHRGPYKTGPGEINGPVSIGGSVISPGRHRGGRRGRRGVVPGRGRAALIEAVRAQIAREEQTIISIREGRYQGTYGSPDRSTGIQDEAMSQKDEFHNLDDPS